MPRFTPQTQPQILQKMLAKTITRAGITDVSDSSFAKHLLAAAARSDSEQYFQMVRLLKLFSIDTATGEDLDERAKDIQPSVITRNQAVKASGFVVFSRSTTTGSVTIPAGTHVKTAGGVEFVTTAIGQITAASPALVPGHAVGRDSNLVSVLAVVPGNAGNVAEGTIIRFSSKPAGVDEVTNLTDTTGGSNIESNDSFRNRIKDYIAGLARCSPGAIEVNLTGLQDPDTGISILFARVIEDIAQPSYFTVYIDDGTGTAESSEEVAISLVGNYTWNGTTVVATSDSSDIVAGEWIRFDPDGQFFRVVSVVPTFPPGANVTIANPGALTIPSGSGSSSKSGDIVTGSLAGPPPGTAVGGETRLYLAYSAVKPVLPLTVWSSTRGLLVENTDYQVARATGQIVFITPLSAGEAIAANYTRFTGIIAFAQKVLDGDPNDRINFPGLRAAGTYGTVAIPQILLQNVQASLTVLDGYEVASVESAARQEVKNYINSLSISDDVIRNELITQLMNIEGVYNVDLILPATDRAVLDDELIRTQDSNISFV